jgi:hypothetical protein
MRLLDAHVEEGLVDHITDALSVDFFVLITYNRRAPHYLACS